MGGLPGGAPPHTSQPRTCGLCATTMYASSSSYMPSAAR